MNNTPHIEDENILKNLKGDKVIWIIVFLLSLFSIALIYSASSSLAYQKHLTNFAYLKEQCTFVAMGLIVAYVCYRIPLGIYRSLSFVFFAATLILLLLTPIIGLEINGARRWIAIGGITFQPAEFAKTTLILYIARALEMWKMDTYKEFFLKVVLPIGALCVLVLVGSFSAAFILGILALLTLIIAGVKWSYILKTIGFALGLLTLAIVLNTAVNKIWDKDIFPRFSTAISRVEKYLFKEEIDKDATAEEIQKKADEELQPKMAKIAISSGKLFGKGPGNSTQRYVLPHPYSDFMYATIVEEYGLLGGTVVILLYLALLFRCVVLAKNCTKIFTAITVAGLGLMITLQAFLHILVNTGIFPVTGHTLPLLSRGGTSFLIFSMTFGIILSVSRTIDTAAAVKRNEKEQEAKQIENKRVLEENTAPKTLAEGKRELGSREDEPALHEIIDEKTGEFK